MAFYLIPGWESFLTYKAAEKGQKLIKTFGYRLSSVIASLASFALSDKDKKERLRQHASKYHHLAKEAEISRINLNDSWKSQLFKKLSPLVAKRESDFDEKRISLYVKGFSKDAFSDVVVVMLNRDEETDAESVIVWSEKPIPEADKKNLRIKTRIKATQKSGYLYIIPGDRIDLSRITKASEASETSVSTSTSSSTSAQTATSESKHLNQNKEQKKKKKMISMLESDREISVKTLKRLKEEAIKEIQDSHKLQKEVEETVSRILRVYDSYPFDPDYLYYATSQQLLREDPIFERVKLIEFDFLSRLDTILVLDNGMILVIFPYMDKMNREFQGGYASYSVIFVKGPIESAIEAEKALDSVPDSVWDQIVEEFDNKIGKEL